MVGFGVWVVIGLWLKWIVGRRRSLVFGSNDVMARLAWVTMMGLVEIGMGHRMVGWFFWVLLYSWSWLGFAFPSLKFLT